MKYLISKLLVILQTIKREILVGAAVLFLNLQAFAQEEGGELDVDLNVDNGDGGGGWFYNWWIWVGLALFVIIIIAIVSAGRRR